MGLLKELKDEFDEGVRRRGREYYDQGLVRITSAKPGQVRAKVHGGAIYTVELEGTDATDLEYSCMCPYADDLGACKHIWATLLKAVEEGHFPDAGRRERGGQGRR